MKRQSSAIVLLVSIGALSVAAAGERLHFVEHPVNEVTTRAGGSADARGNLLTFANPVFDSADRRQVGTDNGFCIRVVRGKSWECFWTLLLRDGQITVEGPFLDAGDSRLAITGGTGRFTGAKGEMTLHSRAPRSQEYDFIYNLR
ncbi:MAG: allene oxide cyclase family protein [Steroidobacteraceae bacterium]